MATADEIRRQVERLRGMIESPERASAEAWLAAQGEAAVPALVAEIETRHPFSWRRAMVVLSRNLTPTALNALLAIQPGLDTDVAEVKQTCLAAYRTHLMASLRPSRLSAAIHLAGKLDPTQLASLTQAVQAMARSHAEAVPAAREAFAHLRERWELAGRFPGLDAGLAVALSALALAPARSDLNGLLAVLAAADRLPHAAAHAALALAQLATDDPFPELRQALRYLRPRPLRSHSAAFRLANLAIDAATVAWKDLPLPAAAPVRVADLPRPAEEPDGRP